MSILRVKTRWTVPGAGSAFTVMHFGDASGGEWTTQDADNSTGATETFFNAVKPYIPSVVSLDIQTDVEEIDVATGNLMRVIAATPKTTIVGSAASGALWAAPVGACITWNTAGLRTLTSKPRRVRGRTFLVPLSSSAFATDGTLGSATLTALNNAATGLRGNFNNQQFMIYGRPGVGGSPVGVAHSVTGHRITDQGAVLRSRRS